MQLNPFWMGGYVILGSDSTFVLGKVVVNTGTLLSILSSVVRLINER